MNFLSFCLCFCEPKIPLSAASSSRVENIALLFACIAYLCDIHAASYIMETRTRPDGLLTSYICFSDCLPIILQHQDCTLYHAATSLSVQMRPRSAELWTLFCSFARTVLRRHQPISQAVARARKRTCCQRPNSANAAAGQGFLPQAAGGHERGARGPVAQAARFFK